MHFHFYCNQPDSNLRHKSASVITLLMLGFLAVILYSKRTEAGTIKIKKKNIIETSA